MKLRAPKRKSQSSLQKTGFIYNLLMILIKKGARSTPGAQPPTLASSPTWGSSVGAARVSWLRCKYKAAF